MNTLEDMEEFGFRSDGNHWNILARGMPYEIIFKGFKIDVVKRIG